MEMSIKKRIGKDILTFLVSGKNLHELVMESQKLSFPDIDKCGNCESDDLYLHARLAQDKFKYTEIKCRKCNAALTFGQTQENPDVFYLRKNESKKFDWKVFRKDDSFEELAKENGKE